jgi:DNA-binding protein HU-beta
VNRRELVQAVAVQSGTNAKEVDAVLHAFQDVVFATVAKGDPVVITNFVKFVKVNRAARWARNPQTGEPVRVKASVKARVTPLKGLKDVAAGVAPAPKMAKAAPAKAAAARSTRPSKTASAKKAPAKRR